MAKYIANYIIKYKLNDDDDDAADAADDAAAADDDDDDDDHDGDDNDDDGVHDDHDDVIVIMLLYINDFHLSITFIHPYTHPSIYVTLPFFTDYYDREGTSTKEVYVVIGKIKASGIDEE